MRQSAPESGGRGCQPDSPRRGKFQAGAALPQRALGASALLPTCARNSSCMLRRWRRDRWGWQPVYSVRCTLGLGPVRSDSSAPSVHGVSLYAGEGAAYQLIFLPKRYCLHGLLMLGHKLSSVERMLPQLICCLHASPAVKLLILHARVLAQRLTWQGESLARSGNLEWGCSAYRTLRTEGMCPHLATDPTWGSFAFNRKFLPWTCEFLSRHSCLA